MICLNELKKVNFITFIVTEYKTLLLKTDDDTVYTLTFVMDPP